MKQPLIIAKHRRVSALSKASHNIISRHTRHAGNSIAQRLSCLAGVLALSLSAASADTSRISAATADVAIKPGARIAAFLPADQIAARAFCDAVGDTGHVYDIVMPSPATVTAPCANASVITLQSRNYPAPELYNSSDDPGAVYEYYAPRLPVESFIAPEALDVILTADRYLDLYQRQPGSPNMFWVNTSLLKALKAGGVLLFQTDSAQSSNKQLHQVRDALILAGFESVTDRDGLLMLRKPF